MSTKPTVRTDKGYPPGWVCSGTNEWYDTKNQCQSNYDPRLITKRSGWRVAATPHGLVYQRGKLKRKPIPLEAWLQRPPHNPGLPTPNTDPVVPQRTPTVTAPVASPAASPVASPVATPAASPLAPPLKLKPDNNSITQADEPIFEAYWLQQPNGVCVERATGYKTWLDPQKFELATTCVGHAPCFAILEISDPKTGELAIPNDYEQRANGKCKTKKTNETFLASELLRLNATNEACQAALSRAGVKVQLAIDEFSQPIVRTEYNRRHKQIKF